MPYASSCSGCWTGTGTSGRFLAGGWCCTGRNERGKLRFGAVTPAGESLLLTQPLLGSLSEGPCWLDGAVRVRLACRQVTQCHPWLDALHRPGPASLGRSAGRMLRSRCLSRRVRSLSGHGRHPDSLDSPLRTLSPSQEALDWVADLSRESRDTSREMHVILSKAKDLSEP